MNFKRVMVGSVVGAAIVASPAAFAGWTGNVGASSKYLFRDIAQNGDAAVQGGMDYGHESGLYFGTWASNIGFGGAGGESSEVDVYAGWGADLGGLGVDLGVLYYWYPEEDEVDSDLSTVEFYGGLSFGPASVTYYYSDETNFFIGDDNAEEGGYLSGSVELPISDTVAITAGVGFYDGDEIERYLASVGSDDDTYVDYSLGISKSLDGGMSFSFTIVDTDIEASGVDDDPEVVVSFAKEFEL